MKAESTIELNDQKALLRTAGTLIGNSYTTILEKTSDVHYPNFTALLVVVVGSETAKIFTKLSSALSEWGELL